MFWCCSCHETKAKKKENERKREKQGIERKQKRKTRRKKKRKEQERDREREIERGGGQKRLRRNKGRHPKINTKCPFLGGKKTRFFVCNLKGKERKGTNKTEQKNIKTQKYQKMSFSAINQIFLLFLVGVQNFPVLTTWPKKRAPRKHYKNRGFSKAIFGQKTKPRNSNYHFCLFLLFQQQNTKISWNLHFV